MDFLKELFRWAPISALCGQDYPVPVCFPDRQNQSCTNPLCDPPPEFSLKLPTLESCFMPPEPSRQGRHQEKNQHRCISCSENWEMKSNAPALGNSLPSTGRNGLQLQQTSASRLHQSWVKQQGWLFSSTPDYFYTWLEISLLPRAD